MADLLNLKLQRSRACLSYLTLANEEKKGAIKGIKMARMSDKVNFRPTITVVDDML